MVIGNVAEVIVPADVAVAAVVVAAVVVAAVVAAAVAKRSRNRKCKLLRNPR